VRNLFIASLAIDYIQKHAGAAPEKRIDVFESYIDTRLRRGEKQAIALGLNKEKIVHTATIISRQMFDQADVGLEVRLDDLTKCVENGVTMVDIKNVVVLLEYARLVRRSAFPEPRISFVHRRFNEYFLALAMLNELQPINLVTITENRRNRDALVLYAELCSEDQALSMIEYCSQVIPDPDGPSFSLPSTYSIRFLIETFSNRRNLLRNVEMKMFTLAVRSLDALPLGLLNAKISVESTGALTEAHASSVIGKAIETENGWIIETAVRATRSLEEIDQVAVRSIRRSIITMIEGDFSSRYYEYYDIFRL
jgi:hypothetical protein